MGETGSKVNDTPCKVVVSAMEKGTEAKGEGTKCQGVCLLCCGQGRNGVYADHDYQDTKEKEKLNFKTCEKTYCEKIWTNWLKVASRGLTCHHIERDPRDTNIKTNKEIVS